MAKEMDFGCLQVNNDLNETNDFSLCGDSLDFVDSRNPKDPQGFVGSSRSSENQLSVLMSMTEVQNQLKKHLEKSQAVVLNHQKRINYLNLDNQDLKKTIDEQRIHHEKEIDSLQATIEQLTKKLEQQSENIDLARQALQTKDLEFKELEAQNKRQSNKILRLSEVLHKFQQAIKRHKKIKPHYEQLLHSQEKEFRRRSMAQKNEIQTLTEKIDILSKENFKKSETIRHQSQKLNESNWENNSTRVKHENQLLQIEQLRFSNEELAKKVSWSTHQQKAIEEKAIHWKGLYENAMIQVEATQTQREHLQQEVTQLREKYQAQKKIKNELTLAHQNQVMQKTVEAKNYQLQLNDHCQGLKASLDHLRTFSETEKDQLEQKLAQIFDLLRQPSEPKIDLKQEIRDLILKPIQEVRALSQQLHHKMNQMGQNSLDDTSSQEGFHKIQLDIEELKDLIKSQSSNSSESSSLGLHPLIKTQKEIQLTLERLQDKLSRGLDRGEDNQHQTTRLIGKLKDTLENLQSTQESSQNSLLREQKNSDRQISEFQRETQERLSSIQSSLTHFQKDQLEKERTQQAQWSTFESALCQQREKSIEAQADLQKEIVKVQGQVKDCQENMENYRSHVQLEHVLGLVNQK